MKPVDWDEVKWKAMILAVLFALAYIVTSLLKEAESKGLAPIVEISELKDYDYKRVAITGWVRSVEQKKGTRGSNYLKILVSGSEGNITVFTTFPVYVKNSRATFIGVYRIQGRFGSFLVENYIVAEATFKEWK